MPALAGIKRIRLIYSSIGRLGAIITPCQRLNFKLEMFGSKNIEVRLLWHIRHL